MRHRRSLLCLLALCWVPAVPAVNTENYPVPYLTGGYSTLSPDSVRRSQNGSGYQLAFSVPLRSGHTAVELRFLDYAMERDLDGEDNFQTGLMLDYVYDFGGLGFGGPLISGIKPFVLAGVGLIQEDTFGEQHEHAAVNAGGGLMVPVGIFGWAARVDARIQGQSNSDSCKGTPECASSASFLTDYQVNLAVQVPLTIFFDKRIPVGPAPDCPIAVVDPATGRRDCATDSDRDGVPDEVDQCPGTVPGIVVDPRGCPVQPPGG